jgi:hypothetical protein
MIVEYLECTECGKIAEEVETLPDPCNELSGLDERVTVCESCYDNLCYDI